MIWWWSVGRFVQAQSNFSVGEIDPLLRARIDLQQYQNALAKATNVFVQPQGGITRSRDTVVLTGPHQGDHLVRGGSDLGVDLAPGLVLEVGDPVDVRIRGSVLDVTRPGDQVYLSLALSELLHLVSATGVATASAARREDDRDETGQHQIRHCRHLAIGLHFLSSPWMGTSLPGSHPIWTTLPGPIPSETPDETFCRTTWRVSPPSSATRYRVAIPT